MSLRCFFLLAVSLAAAYGANVTSRSLNRFRPAGVQRTHKWNTRSAPQVLEADWAVLAEYSIEGYNISQPWPGEPISGWSLQSILQPVISSALPGLPQAHDIRLRVVFVLQPPQNLVASQLADQGFYEPHES